MKMLKKPAIYFSLALGIAACNGGTEGTEAEVAEAQEVVEIEEAAALSIVPGESQVIWNGRKPTGEHHGTIAVEEGTIQLKDQEIVGGTIVMDLNEIDVLDLEGEDEQKLAGHLKSPDFFYVEQHPTAKFVITAVSPFEGTVPEEERPADTENNEGYDDYVLENPTHEVTGNLTLRDTTLSITIPAVIEVGENEVVAKSRFAIDRTLWNVNFQDETDPVARAKDEFIYNKVNIGFDIVAAE